MSVSTLRLALGAAAAVVIAIGARQAAASPERGREPDPSRPTWLWLDTELGGADISLNTFELDVAERTMGLVRRNLAGPIIGVGLGPRLSIFQLGPRARAGFLDRGNYYTIGGELGLHVPISIVEPHLDLGAGYAEVRDLQMSSPDDRISITGYYGRVTAGFDVKASRGVSLGANASYEMALLTPPGISLSKIQQIREDALANNFDEVWQKLPGVRGSSYGGVFSVMGVLGLHY